MFALDGGTIAVAFIVTILGPITMWRIARSTKKQDWARQDAVAAAAQKAADAATTAAAEIVAANQASATAVTHLAALTEGNAADIGEIKTNTKVAVHLADGAFTAAKKSERAALALLLAYKTGSATPPTDAEIEAVHALDVEIAAREAAVLLATTEAENGRHLTPPQGQPVTPTP